MTKILVYVIVLAIAVGYAIYMFKHYRKRSFEVGLFTLAFGTFFIIIGVYRYPVDKAETIILVGLVLTAISAAVNLFEQKQISAKKDAKVTEKEALAKYNELIETYGSLESKSDRPMNEDEIAKVRKDKKLVNIIGLGLALPCLAGAAWVYFQTDNTAYWVLITGFIIGLVIIPINISMSNKKLKKKIIYILKGVVTGKFLDDLGNTYNHTLIVNTSIHIVTSKKLYKSLSYGFIIKAESEDEAFWQSYNIEILGSIMTEVNPAEIMVAE